MSLSDQNTRWTERANEVIGIMQPLLDLIAAEGDHFPPDTTVAALQGAIEDVADATTTDAPTPGSPLDEALSPFFEKINWFCALDVGGMAQSGLLSALTAITRSATDARAELSDDKVQIWTVDEVIADFKHEYRISLLSTMTANHALVNRLATWQRNKAEGKNPGDYLDVAKVQFTSESSISTVKMSVLERLLMAPASVMTPLNMSASMHTLFTGGSPPALFRMSYAQWFNSVYTSWEDVYRPRLARAHGSDPTGKPWTKEDISSKFFGELRFTRNDFVHKKGICVQSADNTIIDWATRGELISPTTVQMLSLLELFPETELREPPTRAPASTPSMEKLRWDFPSAWVDRVEQHVVGIAPAKKQRRAVFMAVIDKWMDETPDRSPQQSERPD
ncbi:hypothetical protein AYK61_26645 [Rhodococcus sp. SBT000017]|uniref:hypothetical protein n=1 Tax=Rhodococcus sp. SBT000017 TaxID=1803385 RepID=UPI000EF95516|nr:hypothetical protein [Rhodococcus sp. SBT000017]RMB69729.1 hypothetical protein AYK61_26645 [Rhodococcus sp. SBT000017]